MKTCALISNNLFRSVDLVTFSQAVNTQRHSNVASITDHWAHIHGKIIEIATWMGHLHVQVNNLTPGNFKGTMS